MGKYKEELENLDIIFDVAKDKDPQDVALVCRQVLEKSIELIFKQSNVRKPIDASLLELINNPVVQTFFSNDVILDELHFIRIVGINAYHKKHIKSTQAKVAYNNTEFLIQYLKDRLENETIELKQEVQSIPNRSKPKTSAEMNEAQTRKVYIDLYLQEAGWEVLEPKSKTTLSSGKIIDSGTPIPGKACCEIPVHGLPTGSGLGFCDYVLYGNDGKPLAIVEAKKTSVDPIVGQQQVREYGNCMKEQYGYVPVLYYTNGYETHIIDGKYPERKVSAFHTIEELSYLIQKRDSGAITDMKVNDNIAGRPYQKIAITNICERFNEMHRRGLLVMATGTGKTRTAIALVELLTRNSFIKNVLFLADRTTLVRQAFIGFKNLLPDMTYEVISDHSLADEPNARISFCTHQTMINFIDEEKKEYSIGRYDLIIIDEAHRSIFNKYGAIFSYFDSLLVGLTATPKDEVDANTYDLFGCETGVPNFAYSLKDAVEDKYLVPYKLVNRSTKQLNNGIEYDLLSEKDKEEVNKLHNEYFEDGDIIAKNKLFSKIFNKDTCRKVLDDLMKMGQRVDNGSLLGKTIIFAANHYHAKLIVDTFNELYPMYPDYCKLIDNQVKNSEHLIDEFKVNPTFRIAVSVDMLDTGVDVPSVLNLVFFKRVNSSIKLIQMIGRGTRLCDGLIDGKNKEYFYVFDYFDNLKDDNPESIKQPVSITQKLFDIRLNMMCEMQTIDHQANEEHKAYYLELKKSLIESIKMIKDKGSERVDVRAVMSTLDKYYDSSRWDYISEMDQREITHILKPLIVSDLKDEYICYSFDYKMLQIEEKLITDGNVKKATQFIKTVRVAAQALLDKASIDDILQKKDDLQELYMGSIWENPTITDLEHYRKSVRSLMKYLLEEVIVKVMIDQDDETVQGEDSEESYIDIRTYKEKVIDYLMENSDNKTIKKIKNLESLNDDDFKALEDILWVKLGSKEEYYKICKLDNIAAFIRSLVGVEQSAINTKFNKYLNDNFLSAQQMEFIQTIISYVRENGDIDGHVVIENTPFDRISVMDLFNNNAYVVTDVVNTLHQCIAKA